MYVLGEHLCVYCSLTWRILGCDAKGSFVTHLHVLTDRWEYIPGLIQMLHFEVKCGHTKTNWEICCVFTFLIQSWKQMYSHLWISPLSQHAAMWVMIKKLSLAIMNVCNLDALFKYFSDELSRFSNCTAEIAWTLLDTTQLLLLYVLSSWCSASDHPCESLYLWIKP